MRFRRNSHDHLWVEVGREYTPPRDYVEPFTFSGRMNYANQAMVARLAAMQEHMALGFTTITYRCDGCKRLDTDVLTGSAFTTAPSEGGEGRGRG